MGNASSTKSSPFSSKDEYVVSSLEFFILLFIAFQTNTMNFSSSANNIAIRAELAPVEIRRWPTVTQMKAKYSSRSPIVFSLCPRTAEAVRMATKLISIVAVHRDYLTQKDNVIA